MNAQDSYGRTPLAIVSEYGDLRITRALLKHKEVDVNAQDSADRTNHQ